MSAVFSVDAVHERTLARLTLELLNGQSADVKAAIDRLIGAMREGEQPSNVRDLRILRGLAELDLDSNAVDDRAPAVVTALHFALRIFPILNRQLSMGSLSPLPADRGARPPAAPALTQREAEVVDLTAQGLSNQEIARQLWISEGTVKKHQSNLFRKLEARNRTEAVAKARHFGMLP